MSFSLSIQSELLKTKRTSAFWLSVVGAGFIPAVFMLAYFVKPEATSKKLMLAPWLIHFTQSYQALNSFLFPMYIILMCTLITQIEFRNNTWKQVYASPRSIADIYFSKFISLHLMILLFFISFNIFMIGSAVLVNSIHPRFTFFDHSIDWQNLMRLNLKTYISILGISAIQFWLSLRFKSFVAPVGIGLCVLIGALIATGFSWEHIAKIPHAHPSLTLKSMFNAGRPFLENHEWNSIGYLVFFIGVALADLKLRKEKG